MFQAVIRLPFCHLFAFYTEGFCSCVDSKIVQFEQNGNVIWIFFFFSSNLFKHFSTFLSIYNDFLSYTQEHSSYEMFSWKEIDIRGIFSFLDFEKSWTYSHPNTTFARYSPRSQFRTAKMTLWHMRVSCELFKNQKAESRNSKSIPTFKHWCSNIFQLQTPFSNKITWNENLTTFSQVQTCFVYIHRLKTTLG